MTRETHKQRTCKAESIEALHRDGQACSSDEAAVTVVEPRGLVTHATNHGPTGQQEESVAVAKPFEISKKQVWQAYLAVKSNGGAAGVDEQSIEAFERDLKNNLYRLWDRLSPGAISRRQSRRFRSRRNRVGLAFLGSPRSRIGSPRRW